MSRSILLLFILVFTITSSGFADTSQRKILVINGGYPITTTLANGETGHLDLVGTKVPITLGQRVKMATTNLWGVKWGTGFFGVLALVPLVAILKTDYPGQMADAGASWPLFLTGAVALVFDGIWIIKDGTMTPHYVPVENKILESFLHAINDGDFLDFGQNCDVSFETRYDIVLKTVMGAPVDAMVRMCPDNRYGHRDQIVRYLSNVSSHSLVTH